MRRDSRLSVALHTLLHLYDHGGLGGQGALGDVITSEALAPLMATNAVVVRRTMAGLREAGIVESKKGHGGGWSLARRLDRITLGDVYDALGMPAIFSIGSRTESPGCIVEQAVNRALGQALDDAEALLLGQLRCTTLAQLATDIRKHTPRTKRGKGSHAHA